MYKMCIDNNKLYTTSYYINISIYILNVVDNIKCILLAYNSEELCPQVL